MPTVRLVNPKRSRVRRAKRLRRDGSGRFLRRKRGRNPAAGGGELLLMNPKRRRVRHRSHNPRRRHYRRRRNRNPVGYAVARPVRRRRRSYAMNPRHHHRRRRNPLGLSGQQIAATSLWAIAGGVATRALPQIFLKDGNTGIMGYGANALTAGILAWAADRFISRNAGQGVLLGGMVMLGGRVISDLFGKTLVSFGDVFGTTGTSGMGAHGDPSFDLGIYTPNEFVVPTWSDSIYQRQDYPFMEPSAITAPRSSVSAVVSQPPVTMTPKSPGVSGLGFVSTGRLRSRFAA